MHRNTEVRYKGINLTYPLFFDELAELSTWAGLALVPVYQINERLP
jgi:hypothetical protein